jgi:1-phosphofructokinase family hexose kinase
MTASAAGRRRVVTVTPNPALDITYHVDGIRLGQTHRAPPPATRAGGKGLNVARVIHSEGWPVLAVAAIGGVSGVQFRSELEDSRVPARLVEATAIETRRTVAFVDTVNGCTTIFNEHGPAIGASVWRSVMGQVEAVLAADVSSGPAGALVVSGSLPADPPAGLVRALVEMAHRHGAAAVVDTSGPGLVDAARAGADLLKPNVAELAEATGVDDPVAAARTLLDLGARRVLVSAGESGMLGFEAASRAAYWVARLPQPLVGNPTGAGDAAVAAAAVLLASGVSDLPSLLRQATAWSAAAVLMPTAGTISPRHDELEQQVTLSERSVDDTGPDT